MAGAAVVVGVVAFAGAQVGVGYGGPPVLQSAGPGPAASAEPATGELTWQAMLRILADTLPPGGHLANLAPTPVKYNSGPSDRYVELEYDDGDGASTLMLSYVHRAPSSASSPSGSAGTGSGCKGWPGDSDRGPRRPGYAQPTCRESLLPDGSRVLTSISGTDPAGLYDLSVAVTRPDGDTVKVVTANATLNQASGKPGPAVTVTRDRPPLGPDGWLTVLSDPRWQWRVPQSTLDAGLALARQVSRFPCPKDLTASDCAVD
ncbi:hypothetical protein GCM10025734_75270 [Kitasatospora paranensis]|uniref:hypothetical protein n=1 Tax=Kitasatospora paranensis TaxID=258053 RepID=UPI0031EC8725